VQGGGGYELAQNREKNQEKRFKKGRSSILEIGGKKLKQSCEEKKNLEARRAPRFACGLIRGNKGHGSHGNSG